MSAPLLPPPLRTARLIFAPLRPADAEDVWAYARDPRVLRHVNARTPERVEDTRAWIDAACRDNTVRYWAVRLAEDAGAGPVVGVFEFDAVSPGLGAVHYALAASCWGRGLATEGLSAVLGWAVAHGRGLAAIETTVAQANPASARVLEKCGFQRVGEASTQWAKTDQPVPVWRYRREVAPATALRAPT